MSRDYAQRSNGKRPQTRKSKGSRRGSSGVPGWIWLIAGLSFGLAIAAFVYIRQPTSSPLSPQAGSEQTQPTLETARDKSGRKDKALTLPPKEKERFTFYEILKNQEVVLPSGAAKSSRPPAVQAPSNPVTPAPGADNKTDSKNPAAAHNTGRYLIQVASLRSHAAAEKQKPNLEPKRASKGKNG